MNGLAEYFGTTSDVIENILDKVEAHPDTTINDNYFNSQVQNSAGNLQGAVDFIMALGLNDGDIMDIDDILKGKLKEGDIF